MMLKPSKKNSKKQLHKIVKIQAGYLEYYSSENQIQCNWVNYVCGTNFWYCNCSRN